MSIEYYEAQHARIIKAMQNKNKQLNDEWMERYKQRRLSKDE
jgi:predicted double-glycine peptidase